ncbi:MAG: hypothetical protein J6D31_07285 [Clostridia bacterium]|nr:hypothetical protein [Clostridia bacterium]
MKRSDLPLAFSAALVRDKRAMQSFAQMGDGEQASVLSRARQARTMADMQLLVSSLAEDVQATEEY